MTFATVPATPLARYEAMNTATFTAQTIGEEVADEVLATQLLYRTGPTHLGECPL